jgi:hypothetical protein
LLILKFKEGRLVFIRSALLHLHKITFGYMAESSIGQRFMQLIQQLGLSKNAFAMSLDKTATVIQHLVDERNKPGYDLICKVFEVYPNVSKDWLLLGQGQMLLSSPTPPVLAQVAEVTPLASAPEAQPAASVPASTAPLPRPAISLATGVAALPATAPVTAPEAISATPVAASAPAPAVVPGPVAPAAVTLPPSAPAMPTAPAPAAAPDAAYLTAALQTQYLQHQLALAEQRTQHLLAQQQLMQQMLDLLQR